MGTYGVIDFDDEEIEAAGHWYGGQGSMLYAITSTGALSRGTIRPRNDDGSSMTDEEWIVDLAERLEDEAERAASDAAKQAKKVKGDEKKELLADREGLRSIAFKAAQFIRGAKREKKKSSHATKSKRIKRQHAMKKPPAQLQREINEALTTPAWAKGLDLSKSRELAKRLHVSQDEIEAMRRRDEGVRRAALPSLLITEAGNGIFVRVSSPGPGYGKYHAVASALKAFQLPIGNAIPPNIFVPVHKAADKTKARTKVEEALRYAGYRV
jgi:hypothetical protein